MKFCDYARIHIESGAGGPGAVSFRRGKNIPFGGPDGGHGGQGGSVFIRACRQKMTLIDFKYRPHYKAPAGKAGAGRLKAGEAGKNVFLDVPLGTEVWVDDEKMVDMIDNNQQVMLVKGGRGGRGNASFASSRNRAPREHTPGAPGQRLILELRLKVLADVGLIGLPNAGKSTLLGALTHADPKIGPYPFTTLIPQLGTWISPDFQEIVLADLPGLVEGAHEGKGLGHRFLAHGERCRVVMHVVELKVKAKTFGMPFGMPMTKYATELVAYTPMFAEKPEIIVLTKYDLLTNTPSEQNNRAQGQYLDHEPHQGPDGQANPLARTSHKDAGHDSDKDHRGKHQNNEDQGPETLELLEIGDELSLYDNQEQQDQETGSKEQENPIPSFLRPGQIDHPDFPGSKVFVVCAHTRAGLDDLQKELGRIAAHTPGQRARSVW